MHAWIHPSMYPSRMHPFIRPALIPPSTRPFIMHSSIVHPSICPRMREFIRPCIHYACVHPSILHSPIHHPFIHSFIYPFSDIYSVPNWGGRRRNKAVQTSIRRFELWTPSLKLNPATSWGENLFQPLVSDMLYVTTHSSRPEGRLAIEINQLIESFAFQCGTFLAITIWHNRGTATADNDLKPHFFFSRHLNSFSRAKKPTACSEVVSAQKSHGTTLGLTFIPNLFWLCFNCRY